MPRRRVSPIVDIVGLAVAFAAASAYRVWLPPDAPGGTVERVTVHGAALEGNLEGVSPDRTVMVYLPPGYDSETQRRYPVVYFLHGYGATAERFADALALPESADSAITAGAGELIVVIPDASLKDRDRMYSNSPAVGDWESFIARDVPTFIDANYRTVASRDGRGLGGHSMGGYGTMRVAVTQPGVFAALYAMSSCCLINDSAFGPVAVDQHLPALTSVRGLALDVGDDDPLADPNRQFDDALTRLNVAHTFEVYDGDHGNRVRQRFETHVLPFFSRLLAPAP